MNGLTSCILLHTLQNIYTKRLMSGGRFTFWEIHLYCGAASLMILTPALIVQSSTLTLASITRCGAVAALVMYHWLAAMCNSCSFPFVGIVGCSVLQYASSITSYAVLHLVSHLTFTIVNVLKRLFIIVAGMLYTHQVRLVGVNYLCPCEVCFAFRSLCADLAASQHTRRCTGHRRNPCLQHC